MSELIAKSSEARRCDDAPAIASCDDDKDAAKRSFNGKFIQWYTDGEKFVACGDTVPLLPPGAYEINITPEQGTHFVRVPTKTEELLRFDDTDSDRVVKEIRTFWSKRDRYARHGLAFKRGVLLYGPPGSGKSCTIQLVMEDVIKLGGIVLVFKSPELFPLGMRLLRQIQPETPVVVIMEDIDATIERYNESLVLNILDGAERFDNIVYLATTNYPEKLGARVVNRPSRFDKRFKIPFPNEGVRRNYITALFKDVVDHPFELDRWIEDTKDLSIAHLKELFVSVVILGDEYEEAIDTLKGMREEVSSEKDDPSKKLGFLK